MLDCTWDVDVELLWRSHQLVTYVSVVKWRPLLLFNVPGRRSSSATKVFFSYLVYWAPFDPGCRSKAFVVRACACV